MPKLAIFIQHNTKPIIAAFDFDGTITKRDTFFDFILHSRSLGKLFWSGFKSLPILALYVLRLIPADLAKEKIFSNFFGSAAEEEFNCLCRNYSLLRLPHIVRSDAIKKIIWHQNMGHILVIVSASIQNWITPWAQQNGFRKVIATVPEIQNGVLTGKFQTKNCNGEEKVRRFLAEYPSRQKYYLYVYGDSHKDQWLFEIADEKFYKKF